MKLANRYILKSILSSTILILVVLIMLFGLFDVISEIKNIGINDYSYSSILPYVGLKIPVYVNLASVLAILMGTMIAFGDMVDSRFTQILHNAGVSKKYLINKALFYSLIISLILSILIELTAHSSEITARNYKNAQLGKEIVLDQVDNLWLLKGNSIIHIEKNLGEHNLQGLTKYSFDGGRLSEIYSADNALIAENNLIIPLGNVLTVDSKDQFSRINKMDISNDRIDSIFDSTILKKLDLKPWDLNLVELVNQISYLVDTGGNYTNYISELYGRLLRPLLTVTLVYCAIPFLFSYKRTTSMSNRIFIGFTLGLISKVLIEISNAFAIKYSLNHLFFAISPILILLTLALILNYRLSKT